MLSAQWAALAVVAMMPLLAAAQPPRSDPANPGEIVAAPRYESAFKDYQPLAEANESPDQLWQSMNQEMARLGGHVGQIRETGANDTGAPTTSSSPKSNSQPAAQPSGHGMHHGHGGN